MLDVLKGNCTHLRASELQELCVTPLGFSLLICMSEVCKGALRNSEIPPSDIPVSSEPGVLWLTLSCQLSTQILHLLAETLTI